MCRRLSLLACASLLFACSKKQGGDLARHIRFDSPSGWTREDRSFGEDRTVLLRKGSYEMRVQLMGGEGSISPTLEGFLQDYQARSKGALEVVSEIPAAGEQRQLYLATLPMDIMLPEGKTVRRWAYEEFFVVPAGARYFVVGASVFYDDPRSRPALPEEWPVLRRGIQLIKPY